MLRHGKTQPTGATSRGANLAARPVSSPDHPGPAARWAQREEQA